MIKKPPLNHSLTITRAAANKKYKNSDILWLFIYLLLILLGLHIIQSLSSSIVRTITVIVTSFIITIWMLFLVTIFFGQTTFKNGIYDFIIGDHGTYSLSRFQAVLWAIVIISSQIEIIVVLMMNRHDNGFKYYQPVFSESSIWLLGLSLSSYLVVKGITVDRMSKYPRAFKRKAKPAWSDLVVGANGLDFTRCQILIWTFIALVVYLSKCFYFLMALTNSDHKTISELFTNVYDEYSSAQIQQSAPPYVPYLPWSFVVLMGLSQGVYVGKKLVPTFKLDDLNAIKQNQLVDLKSELQEKRNILMEILKNTSKNNQSDLDKKNINNLNSKISDLQTKISELNKDVYDIGQFKS